MPETERRNDTSTLPVPEVARRMIAALGPTLVASLAGATHRSAPQNWAKNDGTSPDPDATNRLRFGYQPWQQISASEGGDVARAWFIGGNPWLENSTPITAIREGRFKEVSSATRALLDDSFSA